MAIKKSELYTSLWASCDELRGGMDASQYKDYVLFMLFIKYISDKYANSDDFAPPVIIPDGASFADMIKLKGKSDIGDKINTQIIQPLIEANQRLARSDFPDFNDPNKLGEGKAMVDRLTNLVSIFQKPELNFAKNRAEHDDILGDAYEYLMRHFAQESGKSKGQFYTPSEVSRIIAQVIGIAPDNTKATTTAYDPTCGSGSLLLKVAAEAGKHITLEGQEKDVTTAGLARMNMILHDFPTANIVQGNTLANPKFKDGEHLRTYDYVVANPPFSDKGWSAGLTPEDDPWQRFTWGAPPAKQGDYAYLLHIIRSMKSSGKGAVILPHGVLFRGNAEAAIRKQLVRSGYLKGIIGLPTNLFFGTGIPACILVLDKENAQARKGIFLIDASKGFIKDGNKNRLREQDIHRIVDTFNKQLDVPRYARMVPFDEIASGKNDFNLNLPRYIDASEPEDRHDLHAHMNGGIPERDIDGDPTAIPPVPGLSIYWKAFPELRHSLFRSSSQPGYAELTLDMAAIKPTILEHTEFAAFRKRITSLFDAWRERNRPVLKSFGVDDQPKALITEIGEDLLETFRTAPLLDPYDIYQHLMDYWYEILQDDAYEIAADGWVAKPRRVYEEVKTGKKKGQMKDKGWTCDLIPKRYIVARYFAEQQAELIALQGDLDTVAAQLTELEEEHGGEDGAFAELDKINKGEVTKRLKEIKGDPEFADEAKVLRQWGQLDKRQGELKKQIKDADATLDQLAYEKYPELSEDEIKTLVVDDKWLTRPGGRRPERAGTGLPDPHGPRASTGRTLRNPTAATEPPGRGTDRPGGRTPKNHGGGVVMKGEAMEVHDASSEYVPQVNVPVLPEGYKQTDVGVIPEDWRVVELGNFISLQRGHDLTWRDRRRGEVPIMGAGGRNGFHDRAIAEGPGVVLGRSGASFGQAHYSEQAFWPHNTALYVTDFQGNDPLFVFYFLTAIDFSRHNSGGAQQSLNRNFIAPIPVGVPLPSEQRAIATALSDADALMEALDHLIAKKRDTKKATMQQLLTGQTRLPGFEEDWEVKRLGELLTICHGRNQREVEVKDGSFPILATGGQIGTAKQPLYAGPSVLIGRKGTINKRVLPASMHEFLSHPH